MKILLTLWLLALYVFCAPTEELQDPPYTYNVTLHILHGAGKTGKLTVGLFGTLVPKTVANFVQLSTGEHGYGYVNTTFHRIIDNFMIQGGDIEHKDGAGGYSIYGPNFNDENFIVKHDRPGRLSMANAGPNTQGSQFFITSVVTSWLDGHHVVFGQLIDGLDFLQYLEKVQGDKNNKPNEDVVIKLIDVQKLKVDSNANADYFDELTAQADNSGYFWLVVFALLGLIFFYIFRTRKQTLLNLKKRIALTSRTE